MDIGRDRTSEAEIENFLARELAGSWIGRISESAAAVEKNEDHGRACEGDERQCGEIGDQVQVEAHGCRR